MLEVLYLLKAVPYVPSSALPNPNNSSQSKSSAQRVVTVVCKAKHGLRLSNHAFLKPNLLVDSYDPDSAVDIIRSNTKGQLRFGIDSRGRDTGGHLLRTISTTEIKMNGAVTTQDHDLIHGHTQQRFTLGSSNRFAESKTTRCDCFPQCTDQTLS